MLRFLRQNTYLPGLLTVGLLATLAAWPFLTRVSLPGYTDAEMHAFRTYEIVSAWRAGAPYIRWAPDLFFGYGYPVFHYYAPLSYYLGAAYSFLIGDNGVAGVKFVLVISIYLGAGGMYWFARERWGALAGVVSAAALIFAPYQIYIDPHARGDAPETFAIALVPLMLWAFTRLRQIASRYYLVLAGGLLAGIILSHNLMALVFFGFALVWLIWETIPALDAEKPEKTRFFLGFVPRFSALLRVLKSKNTLALIGAVALGLGLSAFMWLPAVLERDAVQFRNVASGTYFDFRRYFIEPNELFAPAQIFDLGATELRFNYSVGVAQWALGGLGALTLCSARRRQWSVILFALLALGFLFLMLPIAQPVWEAIPPMAFMQFPYRFLGPGAVVLGLLAGVGLPWAEVFSWRHARLAFAALAVAACVGAAMPLMYPAPWNDYGALDAERILATELNGRGIGTTSANDFLPVQVKTAPGPQASIIESTQRGAPDKVNRATLPAGTHVTTLATSPEKFSFRVTGQTEFAFRLFTFYFPGWAAFVDGAPAAITPSDPEGWITFWVPAGAHTVSVILENTWPRQLAWGLSALALLAALGLLAWPARAQAAIPPLALIHPPEALAWPQAALLSLVIVIGLAARWLDDGLGWWRVRSTGADVLVAQHALYTPLENNLALLAYDLPAATAHPGDPVYVTLYWKTLAPPRHNYRVFVHLVGPDGQLWGQSDKWNPQDFPITRWPLDRYIRDEHRAMLAADAPSGEYQVHVGLWEGDTGIRLRVLDSAGNPTATDSIVLSTPLVVNH